MLTRDLTAALLKAWTHRYCWVVFAILSTTGAACRLLSYNQPSKFILWPRDLPGGPEVEAAWSSRPGPPQVTGSPTPHTMILGQDCSICFCTEHLFKLQSQPCHWHCQSPQVTSTTFSACKALQAGGGKRGGGGVGGGSACPLCGSKPLKPWRWGQETCPLWIQKICEIICAAKVKASVYPLKCRKVCNTEIGMYS